MLLDAKTYEGYTAFTVVAIQQNGNHMCRTGLDDFDALARCITWFLRLGDPEGGSYRKFIVTASNEGRIYVEWLDGNGEPV
jgi:hypothetical protein